jgi:hypothetical protein
MPGQRVVADNDSPPFHGIIAEGAPAASALRGPTAKGNHRVIQCHFEDHGKVALASRRGLVCVLAIVLLLPLPALAFPPSEVIVAVNDKLVAPVLMFLALVPLPLRMMLVRLHAAPREVAVPSKQRVQTRLDANPPWSWSTRSCSRGAWARSDAQTRNGTVSAMQVQVGPFRRKDPTPSGVESESSDGPRKETNTL